MAIYRLHAKLVKRSEGRSSTAAAAYIAGIRLHDERLNHTWDYTRRRGVLHAEIVAPDSTPDWMLKREDLWNCVERAEIRRDAQLARAVELALPFELTHEQRVELVREFCRREWVDQGMIADFAIHAPDRGADPRNVHAHVLLTLRNLMGDAGFGIKNRDWNRKEQIEAWREHWQDATNHALEKYGHEARIHHGSYADRGIDREPEPKQGPVATEMERQGRPSLAGEDRRAAQRRNALRAILEQEFQRLEAEQDENPPSQQHDEARRREIRADIDAHTEAEAKRQLDVQLARLDALREQDERIKSYLADQARAAESARRAEEERKLKDREREAHARQGDITEADGRYAQALGQHYDIRDPYASLARAAMTEYAIFRQEQQELSRQIAKEQDPAERRLLELRKEIEGCDYITITSRRIVGIERANTGRNDSPGALQQQEKGQFYGERAAMLREQRKEIHLGQINARDSARDQAGVEPSQERARGSRSRHRAPHDEGGGTSRREEAKAEAPKTPLRSDDASLLQKRTDEAKRKDEDALTPKGEISDSTAEYMQKMAQYADKSEGERKSRSNDRGSGRSRGRGGRSR